MCGFGASGLFLIASPIRSMRAQARAMVRPAEVTA